MLQNFELPRNVLLKALDKAYVAQNISVEGIDQLVGNIIVGAFIAFLDDEIPPKGKERTKTLHITIKCKNYIMPRTLLDNGSSLNVIPMSTLSRPPIDLSCMRKSQRVVRAFDGTKREVLGNIKLPIQVGPCTFNSKFIVMDINPSYNCLFGKPWIHMAEVVRSTLHQKVKFIAYENLISMIAEEDMVAITTISTPYIEVKEYATECSFRSFEVAIAKNTKDGLKMPTSHLSQNTWMSLKQTLGKGAKVGYGLGYQSSYQERYGQMGRQKGKGMISSKLIILPIHQTFRSRGYINSSLSMEDEDIVAHFLTFTINAIPEYEKTVESICPAVYPCPPDFELNNWSTVEVPVIYGLSK